MMGEILTQLNQIPSCSAFGARLLHSCWTDFVYFLTLACPLSCLKILSRWRGIAYLTCRLRGGDSAHLSCRIHGDLQSSLGIL